MNQVMKKMILGLVLAGVIWTMPIQSVRAFEAQDMMKVGTIELGILAGNWQAFTGLGNGSNANRSAIFVLPQIGIVGNYHCTRAPRYPSFQHNWQGLYGFYSNIYYVGYYFFRANY